MTPEEKARKIIDDKLRKSGWIIQDYADRDISLPGVAVREFPTKSGNPADYALFVGGELVGIIEAKKAGASLISVESQTRLYRNNLEQEGYSPVFVYTSTGIQTRFHDTRDPDYNSREIMTFHPPTSLCKMYEQKDTLRSRLKNNMPEKLPDTPREYPLRDAQRDAILGLERSHANNRQRALVIMATGGGKTFMAIEETYRLLKFAKATRILFIVDRRSLGDQAHTNYQNYKVGDRKFIDLYNVQHLAGHHIDTASSVVISTFQRLYSILSNTEITDEADKVSAFENDEDEPEKFVEYNNDIPIDTFDFIFVDEAHRSMYGKWKQILDYFDAFIIGLTATPQDFTQAFFSNNLEPNNPQPNAVSKYTFEDSVRNGVNVPFSSYRILTEANTDGILVEAGDEIQLFDRATGSLCSTKAKKSQTYTPEQLDTIIESPKHIRLVIEAFKNTQEHHFKRPLYLPKTLVFAKNIHHAEIITEIIWKVYGKGYEFCRPITNETKNVESEIKQFRNEVQPRIVVNVDMLNTGFDMPALECLLFMRNIKSSPYAQQMVGRGCRTIHDDRLRETTPDAISKDEYLVVDAVGALDALDSEKFSKPPVAKTYQHIKKLLDRAGNNKATSKDLEQLANRIKTISKRMSIETKNTIQNACDMTVDELIQTIYENIDEHNQLNEAKKRYGEEPTKQQLYTIQKEMKRKATAPFYKHKVRDAILEATKRDDLIVTQKRDELISVSPVNIRQHYDNFGKFVKDNRDRFMALQIIYNTPYRLHKLTLEHLNELEDALKQPPYNLTPEKVWRAYERLNNSKVKNQIVRLTDMITLVRYAAGQQDTLKPYGEFVMEKFEMWLKTQRDVGASITSEQESWLRNIAEQISVSCRIDKHDIKEAFHDVGGLGRFYELFPDGDQMLEQMHRELTNFEE